MLNDLFRGKKKYCRCEGTPKMMSLLLLCPWFTNQLHGSCNCKQISFHCSFTTIKANIMKFSTTQLVVLLVSLTSISAQDCPSIAKAKTCKQTTGCAWSGGSCRSDGPTPTAPPTPSSPMPPPTPPPTLPPNNGDDPSTGFDITLVDMGNVPAPTIFVQAFAEAKARWEAIIVNELSDILSAENYNVDDWFAGFFNEPYTAGFDDLLIGYEVGTIDGPGGTLGLAGCRYIPSGTNRCISGIMQFDLADFNNYDIEDVKVIILHEMGKKNSEFIEFCAVCKTSNYCLCDFILQAMFLAWLVCSMVVIDVAVLKPLNTSAPLRLPSFEASSPAARFSSKTMVATALGAATGKKVSSQPRQVQNS